MMKLKKIACHQIVFEDHSIQSMAVVELEDGFVTRCYPLEGEQPQTEWLSGTIKLQRDNQGLMKAFYNGKELK
ncbi:hypothetical protein [Xylanibacter brevis]|uniref:hypothetical protein n=1 Tax=Xylanibacter brevis TaxID=83231 RepID=UPI000AC85FDE|nr:hypothetical protein [Xylanibacter brevis]